MSRGMVHALWSIGIGVVLAHGSPAGLAVVKSAKGDLHASIGGVESVLNGADLVAPAERITSGDDGKAVLRLLPDYAFMEVRPKTAFTLRRVKSKDRRIRRVQLESGEVVFGLKKKSDPIQCETVHTQATATPSVGGVGSVGPGKFSCRADETGASTILVQDGEVVVYNRAKDLSATVHSGQKAVSDVNGIKVSDATDSELEQVGFRQNTLEVDFVNPETEEFTTLEAEYESNF